MIMIPNKQSIIIIITASLFFSCTVAQENDPMSLYKELTKYMQPNTLSKREKKHGWELLFDGNSMKDWQIMGANYAMHPPVNEPFKEVGEWNRLFLVVIDNKVTQMLNGEIVVEYEKYSDDYNKRRNSGKWERFPDWGKFDEGYIALQNHGTKVWFNDIKLKKLYE
jgi:hypothetical protein